MNNANEIVKLVKYSPKRENLLQQIKNNFGEENEMTAISAGLTKFEQLASRESLTIMKNCMLTLWNECLETNLEPDIRGRIVRCEEQMRSFNFFFGLILSQRIFCHTDNLSKTLLEVKSITPI